MEARLALQHLGFPIAQANDRSALVLLALLQLKPEEKWASASNPRLGTHAIMAFIRAHYEVDYAPNSRETIRRQTLHQFIEAGLVAYNADDPARPTNSSLNNYQVGAEGLALLRTVDSDAFAVGLNAYLEFLPGLKAKYGAAREMARIPVTLPDGTPITLGGGGQNVLLKAMVEEFCERFAPGGQVLYIGDADSKLAVFKEEALAALNIHIPHHGKFPDLVVYQPEKKWLFLMEAASSHGPVDSKRHGELEALFGDSTAGLVYVSAFPDRATLRRFLGDLAWETEVWLADEPSHLMHLNGSRFLGPYED
jgi:type II restriction enzyme